MIEYGEKLPYLRKFFLQLSCFINLTLLLTLAMSIQMITSNMGATYLNINEIEYDTMNINAFLTVNIQFSSNEDIRSVYALKEGIKYPFKLLHGTYTTSLDQNGEYLLIVELKISKRVKFLQYIILIMKHQ